MKRLEHHDHRIASTNAHHPTCTRTARRVEGQRDHRRHRGGAGIVAIAFALPAAALETARRALGTAGPQAASGQVAGLLEQNAPGAFAVTTYADEAALRTAIRDREVYGGISFGPRPHVADRHRRQPGRRAAVDPGRQGIAQQAGVPLRTEDLAPPTADDPRGAGLAASALPITLAGLLPAIALVLVLKREVWTRFAAVVVFAPVAGWTIAALLRYVFGSIDQNFWGVAGGLTLGILAAGLLMLGWARCSAGSAWRWARCWRCCWAIRCPD